jgi:phosphoglycolate phosphatase
MNLSSDIKQAFGRAARWLASLSFRTGCIVAGVAGVCYVVSFAQMLLPISLAAKGTLWVVFFGMAKAAQYTALLILGKEGWRRVRSAWRRRSASADAE